VLSVAPLPSDPAEILGLVPKDLRADVQLDETVAPPRPTAEPAGLRGTITTSWRAYPAQERSWKLLQDQCRELVGKEDGEQCVATRVEEATRFTPVRHDGHVLASHRAISSSEIVGAAGLADPLGEDRLQ
jgi:hypothetical protein